MRFPTKPSKQNVLVILMGASAVMAAWGAPVAARLRPLAHYVLAPFGGLGMGLTASFKSHVGSGEEITPAEADRLKEEVEVLRRRTQAAEEALARYINQESAKRNLFGRNLDFRCEIIPADVAAGDSLPYGMTRVVGKGASHGAETGSRVICLLTDRSKSLPPKLAVVSSSALVGKLSEAGAYYARLQLVSDSGFSIRAGIRRIIDAQRPRMITVIVNGAAAEQVLTERNNQLVEVRAQGDGVSGLVIPEVKDLHRIQVGDVLETLRDDAFLPESVLIGTVTEVREDPQKPRFVTLRVRPAADLNALRSVFIVIPIGGELGGVAGGRP